MFISQIIFESELENKEIIRDIMEKKSSDAKSAEGMLSHECWWKEDSKTAGFSLVIKWDDKESFQNWMKETHKDGHKKPDDAEKININKTLYKFEPVNS